MRPYVRSWRKLTLTGLLASTRRPRTPEPEVVRDCVCRNVAGRPVDAAAVAGRDKVLIGGKLVVAGGRAIGIDRAAPAAKSQAAVERLAAPNADARYFAERIEPIVSNFCRGLADDDMMHRLRRDLGRPDARCHG
jgi:hypothetical protein